MKHLSSLLNQAIICSSGLRLLIKCSSLVLTRAPSVTITTKSMNDRVIKTPSSLEVQFQGSGVMYSKLPVSIKPLIFKLVNNLHNWWFVSRDIQQFLWQSCVLTQAEMN